MFTADWFYALESRIRELGMDSDAQSFDEIKENLAHPKRQMPDEFAENCVYVILAGGFSQKTAKKIHAKIMEFLHDHGADFDGLMALFANKNKMHAVCRVWENRVTYCDGYYACSDFDAKIAYLQKLPHIGKITANHLARNLGEDVVKYDIWIQRLGCIYTGDAGLTQQIDNGKLCATIKTACDDMFACLVRETGLPRGYIDVVLWKAAQIGLIKELS